MGYVGGGFCSPGPEIIEEKIWDYGHLDRDESWGEIVNSDHLSADVKQLQIHYSPRKSYQGELHKPKGSYLMQKFFPKTQGKKKGKIWTPEEKRNAKSVQRLNLNKWGFLFKDGL